MDSGRNSASAIAPAEVRCVDERKSLLREVLSVNAVRRDWICKDRAGKLEGQEKERQRRTPSRLGPEHGFLLISSVSKQELYFCRCKSVNTTPTPEPRDQLTRASAIATKHATSNLFSLKFNNLSVRLRLSTCARYVIPFYPRASSPRNHNQFPSNTTPQYRTHNNHVNSRPFRGENQNKSLPVNHSPSNPKSAALQGEATHPAPSHDLIMLHSVLYHASPLTQLQPSHPVSRVHVQMHAHVPDLNPRRQKAQVQGASSSHHPATTKL